MPPSQVLEPDEEGDKISYKLYRGMIGSLLYFTPGRPDIQLSVGICVRFYSNPQQSHLNPVKRILRYLIGTTNLGLWYEKGTFVMLQLIVMLTLLEIKLMGKAQAAATALLENP